MSQNDSSASIKGKSNISSPLNEAATLTLKPGSTKSIPPFLATASLRIALTAFCLGSIAGLVLPKALSILYTSSWQSQDLSNNLSSAAFKAYQANDQNGLDAPWQRPQLHFYILAWSLFHLLEFVITARWNNTRLFSDSFLVQNGIAYHLAHLFGIVEFLIEAYIWPERKGLGKFTCIGIAILLIGQLMRSLAMIQAGGNFSHQVAEHKRDDHELVTDGLYSYLRHPSYFGFFYWALGTQITLGNPISTVGFSFVLWSFFSRRIRGEEAHLVSFFGDQYVQYRKRTRTLIPFIP